MKKCVICNEDKIIKDFDFCGYQIDKCSRCGFQFLDPQPNDEELSVIYSTNYFLGDSNPNDKELTNRLKRSTASLYMHQLLGETKLEKFDIKSLSLLEIGCGMGDFLLEANAKGINVSGLEISGEMVQLANQRLGLRCVEKGNIETSKYQAGSFDIVASFDVIEHVRNPISYMKKVFELLKGSGIAFLVTPSLDSASARLMGKHWMEYKIEHLYYFNRKSLNLLLIHTGFRKIKFIPNYKILNFDYINRHFIRYPVRGLTPLLSKIRKIIPDTLAYHPVKLIASGVGVIAEKPQ